MFWLPFWLLFRFYDARNLYVQYTSRCRITNKVTDKYYVQYSSPYQISRKYNYGHF